MAPQMPPGRPGTLTPEQEVKLREFWQATLKVFGVYDGVFSEPNGTITHRSATTDAIDATEMNGKKEKRKSRLHVFKRHKHDKDTDLESASTSGAETPSNISQLSIADDDDKHGLTKNFKNAIANSAPDDLRKAFWSMVKHDHPDGLLLRFLRARKWDVEKALVMLISTMHWRAEDMHVDDDVVRRGEGGMLEEINSSDPKVKKEGEDFMAQIRMGKSYLHGVDKEGRPVCVVRVRLHKQGEQSEQSLERFTVYVIETARMLLRPPVDTATIIFDMTGFSMANMDYTPVKFMIKCFEANYPECLGVVLVHKAPWIFQGIWTIIRGWLDPVVAGKVHFTRTPEELESFISRTQIPKELGGDEDWSYTYVEPAPSENSLLSDITTRDRLLATRSELVRKYEGILLDWIYAGDREEAEEKAKTPEAVRGQRDAIAEELRKNYWELDPYLRARSFYDRTGILGKNGALQFYPKMEETRRQSEVWEGVENETSPDDVD
ncbi:CRAL/TRIO domain-containing protein [Lepidopterella palustris CBS 459.81]|uniref:CRAL/TRIO domain-containing protein n=1 Tax=Lepidopterella palustris CBS 459.81 TaxID=1314670 RepID=A0A8E2EI16_9PEZI|nr:CRAL/TRIO domain-containing protein [Lepidopterella palustris CBS 459.81]